MHYAYQIQVAKNPSAETVLDAYIIHERYNCTHGARYHHSPMLSPCAQHDLVACWVSRPKEKTFFLFYILCLQIISVIICLVDGILVFYKLIKLAVDMKKAKQIATENGSMSRRDSIGVMVESGLF